MLTRVRLGLRAFEWLPFPWRFSRLDLDARDDFLRRMEGSRFRLHHELLLLAKIFSTLGYAVVPEVEERIGFETSCRLADGTLPEPAGTAGRHRAPPATARNATWSSSARAPAARPRRRPWPRPGST